MTEEEFEYVIGFIEEKFSNIPPRYIGEIEEFLSDSGFSKEQAMAIVVIAEHIARHLIILHEDYGPHKKGGR